MFLAGPCLAPARLTVHILALPFHACLATQCLTSPYETKPIPACHARQYHYRTHRTGLCLTTPFTTTSRLSSPAKPFQTSTKLDGPHSASPCLPRTKPSHASPDRTRTYLAHHACPAQHCQALTNRTLPGRALPIHNLPADPLRNILALHEQALPSAPYLNTPAMPILYEPDQNNTILACPRPACREAVDHSTAPAVFLFRFALHFKCGQLKQVTSYTAHRAFSRMPHLCTIKGAVPSILTVNVFNTISLFIQPPPPDTYRNSHPFPDAILRCRR